MNHSLHTKFFFENAFCSGVVTYQYSVYVFEKYLDNIVVWKVLLTDENLSKK